MLLAKFFDSSAFEVDISTPRQKSVVLIGRSSEKKPWRAKWGLLILAALGRQSLVSYSTGHTGQPKISLVQVVDIFPVIIDLSLVYYLRNLYP